MRTPKPCGEKNRLKRRRLESQNGKKIKKHLSRVKPKKKQ